MKRRFTLMAEEGGDNPTGGTGGGDPVGEAEGTNLPSEEGQKTSFEVNPDDLQDGKFQGKWSNPQEMADYIKNIEDKHSNLTREIADKNKQSDQEIQKTAEELQTKQNQEDTIKSMLPDFLNNGMVVTPEMQEALKETGLSEQDIKLGAYEFKEAVDKNASYVGGKENYDIIMDYHAENMTAEEKVQFNHSIQDPKNSEALMVGLQTIYERNSGQQPADDNTGRIRGNAPANNNTIKPYESKADLLRDKSYADSRTASQADKAKYRARLKVTPENVWRS